MSKQRNKHDERSKFDERCNGQSSRPNRSAGSELCDESALAGNGAAYRESLSQLGKLLKNARAAKNLSIETLAEKTLVHTRFIRCLEAGEDTQLASAYVLGYLRLLAQHLELKPEPLLELFERSERCNPEKTKPSEPQSSPGVIAGVARASAVVANEALGAVLLLLQAMRRVFGAFPSVSNVQSRHVSRANQRPKAKAAAATQNSHASSESESRENPVALMRSGSAWATPSLLQASSGLHWGAVTASICAFAVVIAIYLDGDPQSNQPTRSTQIDSAFQERLQEREPLGELAVTALAQSGENTGSDANSVSDSASPAELRRQPLPLNRQERQAALVDLQTAGSGAEQRQRLGAIESSVDQSALPQALVAGNDNSKNVRSVINVGEIGGDGQISQNSQLRADRSQLRDSYEPVGPGAEYMISQHQRQDRLVISVYEDSWVDVRDANGVRLYRNLAKAGRRIDLSGDLPFALHVGNAPGLALELNGEYVPIERYRSDNSARLTLAQPLSAP